MDQQLLQFNNQTNSTTGIPMFVDSVTEFVKINGLDMGGTTIRQLATCTTDDMAANKAYVDQSTTSVAAQSLSEINNSNPLNGDLDLRGNHDLLINPATTDDQPITRQQLTDAITSIEVTVTEQGSDFQESVSQAQANSNSYTDTQMAGLQGTYARLDTLTRVGLTNNVFWAGGDIFMSDQTREPGFNPPLFPQYGGIYSLRDSDLSDDRYFVKRQALPRSQILHLIGEAEDRSKADATQQITDALANLDIPTDLSSNIAGLQSSKVDKTDTLQDIQDRNKTTGHVTFVNPNDISDTSATILVPSFNYRDLGPTYEPLIDNWKAVNVEQLMVIVGEADQLKTRVDNHDLDINSLQSAIDNIAGADMTQIKTSDGSASIRCVGNNDIRLTVNGQTDLVKFYQPVGQATTPFGLACRDKIQITTDAGSMSILNSKAQLAQPGLNVMGLYLGTQTGDDQTKNQITQLQLNQGQSLTLASGHVNTGSGMVNFSSLSNSADSSIRQSLLLSGGIPETDPTIRLYSTSFNSALGVSSRPIQFKGQCQYVTEPTIQWGNDIPHKDYVDGVANSWLNTTLWKEFYNNSNRYLQSIRQDDIQTGDTDPYFWNSSNTSASGLLAKAFAMQDSARASLLTNVTTAYTAADAAVTTATNSAISQLQTSINTLQTTTNSAISTLNSANVVQNTAINSNSTAISQLEISVADHESRIVTLESGSGGSGSGGSELQTILNGIRLMKYIGNTLITYKSWQYAASTTAAIVSVNTTTPQPKIPQTTYSIISGLGQLLDPTTIISVVNNNSVRIDGTQLLALFATNTDLRYVYNSTATNFQISVKMTCANAINIGNTTNSTRYYHNVYLSTVASDTNIVNQMSQMSLVSSNQYSRMYQTLNFNIPIQANGDNYWYITQDMSVSVSTSLMFLMGQECTIEFRIIPN